jgi:hypothetical protein
MLKILGGVAAGIFIGAFAVELLNRIRPGMIEGIEDKAKHAKDSVVEAFQSGYGREEDAEVN